MIGVPHYGLHFAAGDVGFLLQKGAPQSHYSDLPCPFQVQRSTTARSCPHAVNLALADPAGREILDDPLAAWFADPTGIAVVHDPAKSTLPVLSQLARLYSLTRPTLDFAWTLTKRAWLDEASITNLSPWGVIGVTSREVELIRTISAYPRPVVLLSIEPLPLPPGAQRLNTDLKEADLENLSLERLGAWAVARRLRRVRVTS